MSGRVYRPYSIISRMLFDLEALHRVPIKQFYPWVRSRKKVSVMMKCGRTCYTKR